MVLALVVGWAAPGVGRAGAIPRPASTDVDPLFDEQPEEPRRFPDPLEDSNRWIFRQHQRLDRWVLEPLADAYACVVPRPARDAVQRVLLNLDAPAVFVNDVLQIAPCDAATTAGRFAMNTTIGLLGLFDPAARLGLPGHVTDFGETLAIWGSPSGAYLVIPFAGPSTTRDAFGFVVDFFFRPTTYVLTPGGTLLYTSLTEGSTGIARREEFDTQLEALEATSVDYYAALASALYQTRTAHIADRRTRARLGDCRCGSERPAAAGGEVADLAPDELDERGKAVPRED